MEEMNFWDHVEAFRGILFRALIGVAVLCGVFFYYMPEIFDTVILAPCFPDFYLYQGICNMSRYLPALPDFCGDSFHVNLINIQLASQFFIHMSTSFWLAVVFGFPFIIYQLWLFISPALYKNEKRNVRRAFLAGTFLFFIGVCIGYFLVFPLTLRFLAGYQISEIIPNQISLDSYMNNFLTMIFIMGLVFELPILCWLLSKLGLLTRKFFAQYRRYAVVGLLLLAAIITPSGDPFTLFVVFLPIYMLYEVSAFFVKPSPKEDEDEDDLAIS